MSNVGQVPVSSQGQGNREQLTTALASKLHDDWRASRRIQGTDRYEPREKTTKDQEWIEKHGGQNKVDIANTPYEQLPADWQAENRTAAEGAMGVVLEAASQGVQMDTSFIEGASSKVHEQWLSRNGAWAPEDQKKPYVELSEENKQKDRVVVLAAVKTFQSLTATTSQQ